MQRNQIHLSDRTVEQNKAFLKALYKTEDLEGTSKWFDTLDCSVSVARQTDESMTLDAYLNIIDNTFHIILQIGSPIPDLIRYSASGYDCQRVNRFAWLECSFNERNYDLVSRLFNQAYGQDLKFISVHPALR